MHFSECPAWPSTAVGIVVVIATACGGATTNATARDAGTRAGDDASGSGGFLVLPGHDAGSSSGVVVSPVDAGPVSDINVATLDAGPAWACYQAHCAAQLAKCSMEPSCNNAFVAAVECAVLGAADNQCFTPAIGSAMDGATVNCILGVYTSMVCSPDGGASDASGD